MNKPERYSDLIAKFKDHTFSDPDLINPHHIEGFDFDVINPWELWHNNLDADILFIGQDFSDTASLIDNLKTDWEKEKKSSTNKALVTFFNILGYYFTDINYTSEKKYKLFFTNAILGIKKSEKADMSKAVKDSWWQETSQTYLKELIGIVEPKYIMAMGSIAYKTVCDIYEIKPESSVNKAIGKHITLPDGKILFVVQHCSPNGRISRGIKYQMNDWMDIRNMIDP